MHPLKMMVKTVSKVKNIYKRKRKDYNNNNKQMIGIQTDDEQIGRYNS